MNPPILGSALSGNLKRVKVYVESGGDINVADKMGNTLLMLAAVDDHFQLVEYLPRGGADSKRRNKAGESALDGAKQGAPKRVKRLLATAMHRLNTSRATT